MALKAYFQMLNPMKSRGFTIIELMVTIALVAILASFAVPSFAPIIASTKLSAATNEVYTSLVQAKTDAVRSGDRVTVCPSSDTTSCLTGSTPTWTTGWITFVDTTRTTASPVVDTGEKISQINQAINDSLSVVGNNGYVSFASDGSSRLINGGIGSTTIRVCSTSKSLSNDNRTRDIKISRTGRIEIFKTAGVASTCPTPPAT